MYGNGIGDAFLALFYFAAFSVGFMFALAVIIALLFLMPVNLGVAFLATIGTGACAALLARMMVG